MSRRSVERGAAKMVPDFHGDHGSCFVQDHPLHCGGRSLISMWVSDESVMNAMPTPLSFTV
jgi:hypothetical protein